MHPRRPVFGLRRVVFYAFFCYFVGKKLQNHERMKQKTHYSEALAYLRDYCLHHGRAMHFSHGDIFETEGAAASRFGYIESGSFHYLVRNYEGDESTVETVAAGDLVGCYPYCLDGDAAPVTIRANKSSTVYVVDGADLNEHYCQITTDQYKRMSLFNASVQYKWKQCVLRLELTNLLNQRSYSYTVFDGINTYTYDYTLCGRTIMMKATFKL